jgi:hypothetical protein
LKQVRAVLADPKSRSEEYTVATDCAVGSLGKLALFHNSGLLEEWVNYLPIKAEVEEAQTVHKMFLSNFEKVKGFGRSLAVVNELKTIKDEVLDSEGLNLLAALIN